MNGGSEALDRLEDAFGFTADELRANENGELSARQRDLAREQGARTSRSAAVAAAITLGVLAVVGPVVLVLAGDDVSAGAVIAYGLVCFVVICAFAALVLRGRNRSQKLARGQFASVSGAASSKVQRTTGRYGGVEVYRVKIGSTRLRLANGQQLSAFDNGANYVVHYLDVAGAPLVLSVRRL